MLCSQESSHKCLKFNILPINVSWISIASGDRRWLGLMVKKLVTLSNNVGCWSARTHLQTCSYLIKLRSLIEFHVDIEVFSNKFVALESREQQETRCTLNNKKLLLTKADTLFRMLQTTVFISEYSKVNLSATNQITAMFPLFGVFRVFIASFATGAHPYVQKKIT